MGSFLNTTTGKTMTNTEEALREKAEYEANLAAEPQLALLAMKSSGENIDVQMGMSKGDLDMDTPHGYMLNWLAQNWEMINKMAQVSFTAYKTQKDRAPEPEAQIIEPSGLKLVSSDGQSLIQQQGA